MDKTVRTILRNATRRSGEPLNILSFPTHERYQDNLAKTGHNFYLWQSEGIKPWREEYAKVPTGTVLLNPSKGEYQIPEYLDIDIVLSQNKFGQFQIANNISKKYGVPLVSIEHTLPMQEWSNEQMNSLRSMRGDIDIFISDYSRRIWGWEDGSSAILHHGVDTNLFCPPKEYKRKNTVLSVVNDWINRDWCCGYKLWENITGFPESDLNLRVIGDTPGLSEPAPSTWELIEEYKRSRVFLNTSLISPVPTALLEAMSCGCAVVSTATCMIPEIIENGKNGYISNDPLELRGYIDMLSSEEDLAKEIGENARQTILEKFGIDSFLEKWNNIFYSCVE